MSAVERIDRYLARNMHLTPCVIIDLESVRQRCMSLQSLLPQARVYYAVKANPAAAVIAALATLGIDFDLASHGEIERCLQLGIASDRFCFGNTIKRESDIVQARQIGIDLYAFDSPAELEKLARAAPGHACSVVSRSTAAARSGRSPGSSAARLSSPSSSWSMPGRSGSAQSALPSMSVPSRPIQCSGRRPFATPHAFSTSVSARAWLSIC